MPAIIRIKRSTGVAAPGTLKTGELSYSAGTGTQVNLGDRLFFGKGDDGSGNATTVEVIGGAYFSNMLDHVAGTLTASSAIIVDANSKIDNLKVDNIDINGNTISSTDTNGNVVISPNGAGTVDVSTSKITSVVDPTDPQDAATKAYVDAQTEAAKFTIFGDTGTDTIDLDDSSLSFLGDSWTTTTVTNNTVRITHDVSGVTAAVYGSATAVPVLTIDNRGHITSATTAAIAATLNYTADTVAGTVNLRDSSFTFVGGEGIDLSASGRTMTIAAEDATSANKGVASFNSTAFTVSAGDVVANPIFLGTTRLDLGTTDSSLAGLSSIEAGDIRIVNNVISSINSGTMVLDPSPVGDSAGGYVGELIIRGNLTVQGVTTTVNSTTVSLNDKNIVLADSAVNAAAADGAGLTVGGGLYSGTKATMLYDGATDRWKFNKTLDLLDSDSLMFAGVTWKEVLEDHLVTNFFLEGEGIDLTYNDATNKLTVASEIATYLNLGAARFDSDQFTVTTGFATIRVVDGGVY